MTVHDVSRRSNFKLFSIGLSAQIIANVEIYDKEAGQGRHHLQVCAGATALGGLLSAIIIPEFFCVNNTP